jgi:hypothetical protein
LGKYGCPDRHCRARRGRDVEAGGALGGDSTLGRDLRGVRLAALPKPTCALRLDDALDADVPLASLFEQRGNPGTALVPPVQVSIELGPVGRGGACAEDTLV